MQMYWDAAVCPPVQRTTMDQPPSPASAAINGNVVIQVPGLHFILMQISRALMPVGVPGWMVWGRGFAMVVPKMEIPVAYVVSGTVLPQKNFS